MQSRLATGPRGATGTNPGACSVPGPSPTGIPPGFVDAAPGAGYSGHTSNSIGMLTAITSSCTGSPRRQ